MRAAIYIVTAIAAVMGAGCSGKGDDDRGGRASDIPPIAGEDESCNPAAPKVCRGDDVIECTSDGHLGRRLRACHDGCRDGRCELTCADDGVKLIYLVDEDGDFLSFDPRVLGHGDPFHVIGKLDCGRAGTPFSMSVDRHGIAWVLYSGGRVFRVSIDDAKCTSTGYRPLSTGTETFGMGFATDAAGAKTEKLYVASNDVDSQLFAIDTAGNLAPVRKGVLTATAGESPELTGTSDARLYGFYPDVTGSPFVQEIDRLTGAPLGPRWPVAGEALDISAYAFAQWGGTFYVFATVDGNSTVRTVDKTGHYKAILQNLPYKITGAGVSTCAPERDQ